MPTWSAQDAQPRPVVDDAGRIARLGALGRAATEVGGPSDSTGCGARTASATIARSSVGTPEDSTSTSVAAPASTHASMKAISLADGCGSSEGGMCSTLCSGSRNRASARLARASPATMAGPCLPPRSARARLARLSVAAGPASE